MSLLGDFVAYGLNNSAKKKQTALQQALLDKSAGISRDEFNKRMAALGLSDARVTDLLNHQYGDESKNQADDFAYQLDQAQKGFNEQTALSDETANARISTADKYFGDEIGAQTGLVTAQKGARLQMKAAADAERTRQDAFQGQADQLASALPQRVGFDAQASDRAQAIQDRGALIRSSATDVAAPAIGGDPRVAAAFAAQNERGSQAGLGDALAASKVSAYGDAFQGANRTLGAAADDLSALTNKAQISRSALPAELGVGQVEKDNAQQRYDFASALAKTMGGKMDSIIADKGARQAGVASDYRTSLKDAHSTFSQQIQKMLEDYYGRNYDTENSYITGLTNSSSNLESKLINLNNFKMGNTLVTSPLASFVKMTDAALEQAARAAAGGGG